MSARPLQLAASSLLIAAGVLALGASAVLHETGRVLLDSHRFASRVAASLEDERVVALVATRVTDAMLEDHPDLTAVRPLVLGAARHALASSAFRAMTETTVRAAHGAAFSDPGRGVMLSVPDVGVLVRSALADADPAVADRIPRRVRGVMATLEESTVVRAVVDTWTAGQRAARLSLSSGLAGLTLVVAGLALAPSPRRALVRLGTDFVVAGVVIAALVPAGSHAVVALAGGGAEAHAAAAVWEAFAGGLRTWALGLGALGLVFVAAGQSLLDRMELRHAARRLAAWLARSDLRPRARLLRGLVLCGGGTLAILDPARAATIAALLMGAVLALAGLREVFRVLLPAGSERRTPELPLPRLRLAVAGTLAVALLVAFLAFVRPAALPAPAPAPSGDACNGSIALCARRLDEVVLAGTHNAMAAADDARWLFPQQERGIRDQLADGIRALLVDVHYGIPTGGRVLTDLTDSAGARARLERAVGPEGAAAARRIRARVAGVPAGRRGLYLCHGFCELGSISAPETLRAVHEFLVRNPREVVVLVFEDYVAPSDLAGLIEGSGLSRLAFRGTPGAPWPTLGQMIATGQRVVLLAESGRCAAPWIHPAFDILQETPFSFRDARLLACSPNRGGTAGSLLLVNHWIDTAPAARPSHAADINRYEALIARARQCEAERGRRPNIIAVDFYRTGALVAAVRALNTPGAEAR